MLIIHYLLHTISGAVCIYSPFICKGEGLKDSASSGIFSVNFFSLSRQVSRNEKRANTKRKRRGG